MNNLASRLNTIITVQQLNSKSDEMGSYNNEYEDILHLPAEVHDISDYKFSKGEILAAEQMINFGYYKIIVRYTDELDKNMRIICNNMTMRIKKIINHNQSNIYLIIIAEEIGLL